ncbi:MAG: DUF6029 family protein [Bacteroidetes bacterium]|nr:DUF6029 family protein [Bacteroidota bacterium]MDA0904041.1 DUF6029 family protein [Bacteroidota bacterium]MDA1242717.1 DUF6029 family protein [Bacteroidota bacterium]
MNPLHNDHVGRHVRWVAFLAMVLSNAAWSQESEGHSNPSIQGNVSVLWQSYAEDSLIGAQVPPSKTGYNAFANLLYNQGNFSAGVRYESYLNAVLGFPGRFKGSGVGYRFARYQDRDRGVDVTVGNFYDQFGSGLVLRAYEERNLGIDNALDGFRLVLTPIPGIEAKFLYGKQRFDFEDGLINGPGTIRAVNGEADLNQLLSGWEERPLKITCGASFVSKFQPGSSFNVDSLVLGMPLNIGAWSYRVNAVRKGWTAQLEYAGKINDPSADNAFTYRPGEGALATVGYSQKGLGVLLTAKMVDNMSFRSDRDLRLFDLPVNYIPAVTQQHTYNLAATLYPYATVISGETSASAEVFYTIPKDTRLGGKYGTKLTASFAAANSLDTTQYAAGDINAVIYGYERNSWGPGDELYVRDFNVTASRKFNKNFKAKYSYFHFEFNTLTTPVTTDYKGIVDANIHVIETQWKVAPKQSLRTELQGLWVGEDKDHPGQLQDKGHWATLVAEYTWSPHWFVSVIDQYNFGNNDPDRRIHYVYGSAGYIQGPHRLSVGYGKRREGIFCVGGVCRAVPASNGFEIAFTSSF